MSRVNAIELLQKMVSGKVELNVPMSSHTTMRTGGHADILITPTDREDLSKVLRFLSARGIDFFTLGNGSGIIVRDGGIRGAVITMRETFTSFEKSSKGGDTPALRAEAGLPLSRGDA